MNEEKKNNNNNNTTTTATLERGGNVPYNNFHLHNKVIVSIFGLHSAMKNYQSPSRGKTLIWIVKGDFLDTR